MKSPTQQSLKHLRKLRYTVQITEHWNPFARRRVDLFGFGDIMAIKDGECLMVQTTSGPNVSARLNKIQTECIKIASQWLSIAGHRISVHGWAKRGPRGQRKVWTLREVEVTKEMLTAAD